MNAYTFILAFICEVTAFQSEDFNVGTVLFSPSDVRKKRWSVTEIGLLRARRHFQTLIPASNMINTNEDFVHAMLNYFKESYISVKSAATDPESDIIMNAALSDTIGGYLKAWVLPITKFAFYGGTVSQEDATKVFQFYEEIKNCLNTNGRSWRSPNSNLLNTISINIAPLRSETRRSGDPCDSLAYFEKTDTGLAIPVPNVNWNDDSPSIFIPLKNLTPMPLRSPNSGSLFKYYDAATSCIKDSKLEDESNFEKRFQDWLANEVIPHLNDDKLYPALGNVLSLVNKTRNLVDSVIDIYDGNHTIVKNTTIAGIPINLSSKKMMVIAVIIILEIGWCIPTICYLLYTKMMRKKRYNDCLYVERGTKCVVNPCLPECTQCTPTEISVKSTLCKEVMDMKCSPQINASLKLAQKAQIGCSIEARYSTTTSKHSQDTCITKSLFGPQMRPTDVSKIFLDRQDKDGKHPRKKTSKKLTTVLVNSSTSREVCSHLPDKFSISKTDSFATIQELVPNKTVTIFKNSNIMQNSRKTAKNAINDKETQKIQETVACAIDSNKNGSKKNESGEKLIKTATTPLTDSDRKPTRIKNQKDGSRGGLKLNSGKPYLEITIDKQRHISMDFSLPQQSTKARQSKIPKRTSNSIGAQTLNLSTKHIQCTCPSSKRKSMIPQPKRQQTVDDIIVNNKKTCTSNKRLNETL